MSLVQFKFKVFFFNLVWLDVRNTDTVDKLLSRIRDKNAEYLKPLCGLPLSTYFSALKMKWMLDNVPEVARAVEERRCYFGTVDTWLIWVCSVFYIVLCWFFF